MEGNLIIEWSYTPEDYFEEPYSRKEEGYEVEIKNGRVTATLPAQKYDEDETIEGKTFAYIFSIQLGGATILLFLSGLTADIWGIWTPFFILGFFSLLTSIIFIINLKKINTTSKSFEIKLPEIICYFVNHFILCSIICIKTSAKVFKIKKKTKPLIDCIKKILKTIVICIGIILK